MADKIDPNLTIPLNNNSKDSPKALRDQLIPEEISHISSRILTTIDTPNYGVVKPEAIVVKTFGSAKPKVGSIPWTKRVNLGEDTETKPFVQCMVSVSDGQNLFTPQPSSITNVKGTDHDYVSMTTLAYSDDANIIVNNISVGDRVQIEYVDGIAEAKIVAFISKGNVQLSQNDSNQISGDGTNLGDYGSNSTGDGTQTRNSNTPVPDGKCGDNSSEYKAEDCKSSLLEATGQTATLHPVFWGKINDMLKEIKDNTGTTISVGETYRSKTTQFNLRKSRCPAALEKLGEQEFKSAPWSKILQNGPCLNNTPVGAVEGSSASNHLKGLAVDFRMDMNCPASNVNSSQYSKCRSQSIVFKLLSEYAPKYGIKNLNSEPWHWSSNGG